MRSLITLTVTFLRVRSKAKHAGLNWKETINLIVDSSIAHLDWMDQHKDIKNPQNGGKNKC